MGNDEAKANPNLVKLLVDLWMHQNQLMWSRVQLLIAVQGAVFAANYALGSRPASLGLFFIGIVSTLYLAYVWDVDRTIRNKYSAILGDTYDFHVGYTPEERRQIRSDVIPGVSLPIIANSRTTLRIIFGFLILLDLIVLFISLCVFKR